MDMAKLRKTVEAEFAAKQSKAVTKQKQPFKKSTAKVSKVDRHSTLALVNGPVFSLLTL
jgi:hypothetical protein